MNVAWLTANRFGRELILAAKDIEKSEALITLKSGARTVIYDGTARKEWRSLGIPVYEIEDINKESGLLKTLAPEQIYAKIRALSRPYFGAYIEMNGKKLVLWRAEFKWKN